MWPRRGLDKPRRLETRAQARTYRRDKILSMVSPSIIVPPSRNPVPRTCVPFHPASATHRGRRRGHPSR
eukprot:49598-Prymnesium_polylepis.1